MALRAAVLLMALAVLIPSAFAATPVFVTDIVEPTTIPFNPSLRPWTEYMPLDNPDISIGADVAGEQPTQVHLSVAGTNEIYVMWATGEAKVGNGTLEPNELTPSIVHYGTSPEDLNLVANGSAEIYNQIYPSTVAKANITNAENYTSPVLHNVLLQDLEPNTTYYYSVGDGEVMSEAYSFRSMAAVGSHAYPQRIGFIADWGYSYNSSTTLQHIINSLTDQENPPVVFYIADYCYADGWLGNGTASGANGKSATGYEGQDSNTYQPVWDAWMRFIQPLVSEVPMIGGSGNHEIEQQYDANYTIFASVKARWKYNPISGSWFYHSENFGAVHSIFLSPYVDYTPGSAQWNWLWNDLATVNRTATPWVLVNFHNPWITTDGSYKQFEQMRVSMEPLTYQYGVDAFFYGHVHAYERTAPLYNWLIEPCGAVHITIGDGGNSEGVSGLTGPDSYPYTEPWYEDANGNCPNVTESTRASFLQMAPGNKTDHWSYYKTTLTFQADGNSTGPPGKYPSGYCYKEQPIWSQYRESSFGHGTLDVLNSTHALWQWHRNQDAEDVVADAAWFVRNTTLCPQKMGSAGLPTSGIQSGPGLQTAATIQSAGR